MSKSICNHGKILSESDGGYILEIIDRQFDRRKVGVVCPKCNTRIFKSREEWEELIANRAAKVREIYLKKRFKQLAKTTIRSKKVTQ